ncbi:FYVE, RhoGEF and PH domain-containing protein 3, partial [Armadillidium nasatum]
MENFEEVNGLEYVNSESKPSSCSTPKEFSAANDTSNEYISQLLDQKSHTHIPPPAGFDYPTRPSTLLAALVRGPVSLDEASLSPATQRRLQYINKHSQSSHQFSSYLKKRDLNLEGGGSTGKESECPKLPTSPLSPPSPFQHPFFRKQLGLLPVDAWSRFSGFDFPHFGSIFKDLTSRYTQQQEKESNEVFSSSEENVYVPKRRTINIERENSEKRHYRERKAFSQTYSESESDDDDDNSFSTPITNKNFFLRFSNSHFQAVSGSKEEFGTQYSSSSVTSSSKINNLDLGENADSQSYKDLSYEADIDEDIKSITSKQESFHDCASDCNSYNNISCPEDEVSRDKQIVEKNDVDNNVEIDKNTENSFLTKSENSENSSKYEKIHKIVLELLCTERSYVNVLHLLDQEFQFRVDQENRVHHMFPPEQMAFIFSNIKSIYKLHHDFLLPQLEERIAQWDSCCKIGDIMKNFAPFLKMYTEYVKNFDTAMTFINNLQAKNSRFASIMDDIHQMECCGNLTLQHHMLSPVQRIPRYELLLKDYLRKLPETSADREDTEEALRLVSTAANHANEAMKKIDKFKKLLEIQESLGGALELVSPTRELLKEGKIIKISARSGDHQERYVFLLSDILLLCTPRLIGGRVMSGQQ